MRMVDFHSNGFVTQLIVLSNCFASLIQLLFQYGLLTLQVRGENQMQTIRGRGSEKLAVQFSARIVTRHCVSFGLVHPISQWRI